MISQTSSIRPFPRKSSDKVRQKKRNLNQNDILSMHRKLNGLDLFSGIGGFAIALDPFVNTVAYCEQDKYCQAVLLSRIEDGKIPNAPIWDDIRTLHSSDLGGIPVDIIIGGFPCQNISCAGRGEGLSGAKSGLFFEIVRLANETNCSFLFLENVPNIRTRGLEEVITELAEIGFDSRWLCVSASAMGAPHQRERWFCFASRKGISLANTMRESRFQERRISVSAPLRRSNVAVENSDSGIRAHSEDISRIRQKEWETQWNVEPDVDRVADGVSLRSHRLHALGNAVVPAQARFAFEKLTQMK
jgi:DNA (cytosine-5)-methyltransferase 1